MEERLQKFVKLVEAGSFTKAAEIMHISQPALTVAIAKLERELGAQLLVRDTRPLELSEAGKIAYSSGIAQGVVLDNLRTELSDIAGRRPIVALGMIDSVAAVLSAYATPLSHLGESADVSVIVNDSQLLRDSTAVRALDIAIVAADANSRAEPHIADELMVLVTSPMERVAKEAELKKGKISDFISYPQASLTQQTVAEYMRKQGITLETRLQSSSPEVIVHMVVSGGGVALLPYFMVRSHIITRSLVVMQLAGEPVTLARPLSISTAQGKHQAKCVTQFVDEVSTVLDAAYNEAMTAIHPKKRGR
jgi:DNA-binding transcriptional LysR family regulator